jgi:hypothetical protein
MSKDSVKNKFVLNLLKECLLQSLPIKWCKGMIFLHLFEIWKLLCKWVVLINGNITTLILELIRRIGNGKGYAILVL